MRESYHTDLHPSNPLTPKHKRKGEHRGTWIQRLKLCKFQTFSPHLITMESSWHSLILFFIQSQENIFTFRWTLMEISSAGNGHHFGIKDVTKLS